MYACNCFIFRSCKIGNLGQEGKQVYENILAAKKTLEQKLPGGFENVRSVHLSFAGSVALPIYTSLGWFSFAIRFWCLSPEGSVRNICLMTSIHSLLC